MKRFTDTETWKYLRTAIEIAGVVLLVLCIIWLFKAAGISDALSETEYTEAYILCHDYVNVRPFPNRKGDPLGRFECGQKIFLDGKRKNGYLHCVDTGLESDGWVFKGYVVYDEDEPEKMNRSALIVSKGRLAARNYVNGRRTRWLKPLATLVVYCWSDDWCVTNCGYVQSRFLELQ